MLLGVGLQITHVKITVSGTLMGGVIHDSKLSKSYREYVTMFDMRVNPGKQALCKCSESSRLARTIRL